MLESPFDSKEIQPVNPKGNQSWVFMEWLMLMLKLQFFGQLMWRTDSLEKILMLEKIEGRGEGDNRGWDGWMASPTQWTLVWVDSELMMDREAWCAQFMGLQTVGYDWATELNWT